MFGNGQPFNVVNNYKVALTPGRMGEENFCRYREKILFSNVMHVQL